MYVVLDCRGVSLEISYGQARGGQELKFEVSGMDEAVAALKGRGAVFEEIEIGMRAEVERRLKDIQGWSPEEGRLTRLFVFSCMMHWQVS